MPRPGAMRRFIDYPAREYPSSHAATVAKARGSALGWEQPNEIVSALQKFSEWSPIDTEKPAVGRQPAVNRTMDFNCTFTSSRTFIVLIFTDTVYDTISNWRTLWNQEHT